MSYKSSVTTTSPPITKPAAGLDLFYNQMMEVLTKGKATAMEFQSRLIQTLNGGSGCGGDDESGQRELANIILECFNDGLSLADHHYKKIINYGGVMNKYKMGNSNLKPPDDQIIGSSNQQGVLPRDRRGCHKRRRTCESSEKITEMQTDDGHAWRKYGQKQILNTTHPRNYYRCTHKIDQACLATKQVQKISDNPEKYKTVYIGQHTCKNPVLKDMYQLDEVEGGHHQKNMISFETAQLSPLETSSSTTTTTTSTVVQQQQLIIKQEENKMMNTINYNSPSPITPHNINEEDAVLMAMFTEVMRRDNSTGTSPSANSAAATAANYNILDHHLHHSQINDSKQEYCSVSDYHDQPMEVSLGRPPTTSTTTGSGTCGDVTIDTGANYGSPNTPNSSFDYLQYFMTLGQDLENISVDWF